MNGPESFSKKGGSMPNTPKELPVNVRDALQRLHNKVGPQIEAAKINKDLELAKHGVLPTSTPVLRSSKPARKTASTPHKYNVRVPKAQPVQPFTEVEQRELFPDGKGGWIRKEE